MDKEFLNTITKSALTAADDVVTMSATAVNNVLTSFKNLLPDYTFAKPSSFSSVFSSLGYNSSTINNFNTTGWSAFGSNNSYLDNTGFSIGVQNWGLYNSTSLVTLPSIASYGTSSGMFDALAGFALNPIIYGFNDTFSGVKNRRSPLTLDLDGDGIETTSMDNGVFFDIDNDNYAEKVGWVSADDGLLAMDVNNDGQINNITELYGDDIMPAFQKLALHDSNKNGKIDQGDADYSKLLVWRDLNQDGHTDSGETQTLEQAGVKEISLAERNVDTYQNENYFSSKASYTKFDNTVRDITDVHFLNDNVNTWFMGAQSQVYGSTYQVKAEALLLPLSRGYGSLASLHIAMTNDDVLLSQMEELATLKAEDFGTLSDKMTAFLYQWAGVQDNDPEARATGNGSNIDARKVDFLEQFTGVEWAQMGAAGAVG